MCQLPVPDLKKQGKSISDKLSTQVARCAARPPNSQAPPPARPVNKCGGDPAASSQHSCTHVARRSALGERKLSHDAEPSDSAPMAAAVDALAAQAQGLLRAVLPACALRLPRRRRRRCLGGLLGPTLVRSTHTQTKNLPRQTLWTKNTPWSVGWPASDLNLD